jgi:hypothetical protein
MSRNYPANWDEIREEVIDIFSNRCACCHQSNIPLEVHHVVPVSQGGSHQISNLVPLCSDCHSAAHGNQMAPRVRWYTNGQLKQSEFNQHLNFWKELREEFGSPRYDPQEDCVYIPIADRKKITNNIQITTSSEVDSQTAQGD